MAQSAVEYPERVAVDLTEKAPIRVLHVDDEAGFLKAAKPCLEMQGAFQVETALSVEEATEKMKQKPYDVIVSDYVMSGKDGLKFLKELRDSGNNIPFIIFTGKGREEIAIKALNLGADQYLNKTGYPETVYGELAHSIRRAVERKRAEERIRESEVKFRNIFENANDCMIYLDRSGRILDVNRKAVEVFGGSKKELLGKHFAKVGVVFPRDIPRLMSAFAKGLAGKLPALNLRVRNKKGQEIPLECLGSFTKIDDKIAGMLVVARDVTERKRMEEALRKSEEKYRTQFEEAMDAIFVGDAETGIIIDCNRAASELVGREKSELVGKHQRILHPPEEIEGEFSRTFKQHLEEKEGQVLETQVITEKGEIKDVAIKGNVFELRGKKLIQGIFRDITERKKSEKALTKSEERFKTLMEDAPICICNTDLKGKITYVNKRFEEVTGFSRREIVGRSGWELVSDETKKILMQRMKQRLMGKPSRLQHGQFKSKDGKWIWTEMESKIIKKFGIPVGFQHFARDITERKKAEEELKMTLEKLKVLNEKLGVVGKFTRHDARNKLSAVTMNVFLAKQKLAGDHEALEHLSEIESAVGQVERIFDFARIYEMLGVEELVYVDVEKIVGEAVMLFSDLHGIKVVNDCRGLTVLANSLLRQLFYNLIDNSLKHGEKVSQISVYYEETGKDKLKLVYDDDGVGVSKAEKEKIFKEGYGKGTGYGLFLIRKMCDVYGWTIRETGKQGKGAKFTITIPRVGKNGEENFRLLKNFAS